MVKKDLFKFRGEKEILHFFKREIKRVEKTLDKINELYTSDLPGWERFSIRVSQIAGSWGFILTFLLIVAIWISGNIYFLFWKQFDPYPFSFFNFILSAVAVIQAPLILMAQNRFARKDQARMEMDLEKDMRDLQIDQKALDILLKLQRDVKEIKK